MTRLRALNLIDSQWQGTLGARAGDSVHAASGQEIGPFAAMIVPWHAPLAMASRAAHCTGEAADVKGRPCKG